VRARYVDPLDEIWIGVAKRVGLTITRAGNAYASTDGRGALVLADPSGMDPDDCVAQMVLHELCHSLVAGPESFGWADWGLDNETERHQRFELATLRVQAALLEPHGLRRVLAPTTDYRAYYDTLPEDPFEERSLDERESIVRAKAAFARARTRPWSPHLETALIATREVLEQALRWRDPLHNALLPSLASLTEERAPQNRAKLPLFPSWRTAGTAMTCAQCAWFSPRDGTSGRCLQAGRSLRADEPRCERFERIDTVNCSSCGACCREAYQAVLVSRRDPHRAALRDHLLKTPSGYELRRAAGRCHALEGGTPLEPQRPFLGGPGPGEQTSPPLAMPGPTPFSCSVYPNRPKTCRDFALRGQHCLDARRRVGLSL
jgi:Fe-S-cluster containining protein